MRCKSRIIIQCTSAANVCARDVSYKSHPGNTIKIMQSRSLMFGVYLPRTSRSFSGDNICPMCVRPCLLGPQEAALYFRGVLTGPSE